MAIRTLAQAKKGDSVIIGYVLLIVLAVGMAAAVYSYLKFYVPKDHPECPDSVSLAIKNMTCSADSQEFTINLVNKGLFTVQGAYIKIGDQGRVLKTTINCPNPNDLSLAHCSLYFNDGATFTPLQPDASWGKTFSYQTTAGEKDVEVEPIVFIGNNNTRVLCENAVVKSSVTC